MRRMIGAILIETRPDRMIMSAWRGEARTTSAPKREMSLRGEPITVIISIAQQARPKPSGQQALRRAQFCAFSSVVSITRSSTYSSSARPSRSPRSICCARELARAEVLGGLQGRGWCAGHFHSSAPLRQTYPKATNSRRDEDRRLDQREDPDGLELDGDRVEEDDLDVEQDEQHRDQVEADPEAEALLDVGGQAALVGLALRLVRPARAEHAVGQREDDADGDSEGEEDEGGEVGAQHWRTDV